MDRLGVSIIGIDISILSYNIIRRRSIFHQVHQIRRTAQRLAGSPRHHNLVIAQIDREEVGTNLGRLGQRCTNREILRVYRHRAGTHPYCRCRFAIDHDLVARLGRTGRDLIDYVEVEPPGFHTFHRSGVAQLAAGIEMNEKHILVEIEAANATAIVVSDVAPLPVVVQRMVVENRGIVIHPAVHCLDAGSYNCLVPSGKDTVGQRLAVAVRAQQGVAATDDVQVAAQSAVLLNLAAVGQRSAETEILAQLLETQGRGEQLGQRCRNDRPLGIVGIDLRFLADVVYADCQCGVLHSIVVGYIAHGFGQGHRVLRRSHLWRNQNRKNEYQKKMFHLYL